MTRRAIGAAAIVIVLLSACGRAGSNSGATPDQVYAAGPSTQDIRGVLSSSTWWPGTPSFQIKPLGLPQMPDGEVFAITQHWVHVGTPELLVANYAVWKTSTLASQLFSYTQSTENTITGPKVGDGAIYWDSRSYTDTGLFDAFAMIRSGTVLISIDLSNSQDYVSTSEMGRIGSKLVSKLKSALSGHVKPSPLPASDRMLLLPEGNDVTLAASVRLPIEVAAEVLAAASPQDVVDSFSQLGVKDFLYGDYALDADLNMEVRAIVFNFSSPDDAGSWIDLAVGKSNLDSSGVATGYSTSAGEYYAIILAGRRVGLLFCNSLSTQEAASRACEAPLGRLIGAWQSRLAA